MNRRKCDDASLTPVAAETDLYQRFVAFKNLMGKLLGKESWTELKMSDSVQTWQKHSTRLLQTSRGAIRKTVLVRDEAWFDEAMTVLDSGVTKISHAITIEGVMDQLITCYIRLSFLQLGKEPKYTSDYKRPNSNHWFLGDVRTVQYVRSTEQIKKEKIERRFRDRKKQWPN